MNSSQGRTVAIDREIRPTIGCVFLWAVAAMLASGWGSFQMNAQTNSITPDMVGGWGSSAGFEFLRSQGLLSNREISGAVSNRSLPFLTSEILTSAAGSSDVTAGETGLAQVQQSGLIKMGTGRLTLTGSPDFSGSLLINTGMIESAGTLTLSAGSTIDLGSGASDLAFADGSVWTSNSSSPLSILSWPATSSSDRTSGQLVFNSSMPPLLSQISFPEQGIVLTEANRIYHHRSVANVGSEGLVIVGSGGGVVQLPQPPISRPTNIFPVTLEARDDFNTSTILAGKHFSVIISLSGSPLATNLPASPTREVGEPRHNLHTNGASHWLNLKAPASGRFSLSLEGFASPVVAAVYTGTNVGALTLVTNNLSGLPGQTQVWLRTNAVPYWLLTNSAGSLAASLLSSNAVLEFLNTTNAATYLATQLVFNATAGQTYRIAFDAPVIRSGFTNEPFLPTTGFTLNGDLSTFALQSPASDQIFLSGPAIPLMVAPFDTAVDGTITQVDFYSGTNWIGSATAPFEFGWSNAPAGLHELRAVAASEVGIRVTEPVKIRVLPSNDLFATAATLPANGFFLKSDLGSATTESGEPVHTGNSQGKSLWWKWTPTADGDLSIATTGSVGAVSLSVYTGSQLDQLSLVASNIHLWCSERCGCGWRAHSNGFSFGGLAGQTYYIAADQHADYTPRYLLGHPSGSGSTNSGSGGILTLGGQTNQTIQDVIYQVNSFPQGDQPLQFLDSNVLSLYPVGNLVVVLRAPIPTAAVPNLESYPLQLAGNFVPGTSPNNRFDTPTLLTLASNAVAVNNFTASKEPGEPWHGGKRGGRSVWYSWTAAKSGHVWLSTNVPPAYLQAKWTGVIEVVTGGGGGTADGTLTLGSIATNRGVLILGCGEAYDATPPFTPVFGIYTGNSVSALTTVGGGKDVLFPVTAGTTYRIAVDEELGQAGNFTFRLVQIPTPSNDLFANRITMVGTTIGAEGNNVGATADAAGLAHSVWWQWTALSLGPVNLSLGGSDAQFPVAVFTGTNGNALTPVASGEGGVSFMGKLGTTYQIAIGSRAGTVGNYHLALTAPPVVISPALVTGSYTRFLNGFAGTNGQWAMIQRQALPGQAWTNVVLAVVSNGVAMHSSLPASFPVWENYRALLFEGPLPWPRADLRLSGLLTNGNYRLCLDGIAGLKFRIKTSTNLIDWVPLSTNTFSGEVFDFLHTPPTNSPSRYYMAEPLGQ